MKDAKEKSREQFDRQAPCYDRAVFGSHARKLYPVLLEQLEGLPRRTVLDVGCGGGANFAVLLKRSPKGKADGLDHSTESVAASQKKNEKDLGLFWQIFGHAVPDEGL